MGSFHGIISFVLFALAMLVGIIGVALEAPAAARVYALLLVVSFLIVCGAYCAKCPCRAASCGHLVPGLVAQYLFDRRQGPYNTLDLALTAAALAAMEIVLRVCRCCRNTGCPMQRLYLKGGQVMDRR